MKLFYLDVKKLLFLMLILYSLHNSINANKRSPEASRYSPLSRVAFVIYILQYGQSQVSLTSRLSQLVNVGLDCVI